jgi:hypothetical protein
MQITPAIARAAGTDAANKQMRGAGRSAWNEDDYNLASETMMRLLGMEA